jgi:hypothetical protein
MLQSPLKNAAIRIAAAIPLLQPAKAGTNRPNAGFAST